MSIRLQNIPSIFSNFQMPMFLRDVTSETPAYVTQKLLHNTFSSTAKTKMPMSSNSTPMTSQQPKTKYYIQTLCQWKDTSQIIRSPRVQRGCWTPPTNLSTPIYRKAVNNPVMFTNVRIHLTLSLPRNQAYKVNVAMCWNNGQIENLLIYQATPHSPSASALPNILAMPPLNLFTPTSLDQLMSLYLLLHLIIHLSIKELDQLLNNYFLNHRQLALPLPSISSRLRRQLINLGPLSRHTISLPPNHIQHIPQTMHPLLRLHLLSHPSTTASRLLNLPTLPLIMNTIVTPLCLRPRPLLVNPLIITLPTSTTPSTTTTSDAAPFETPGNISPSSHLDLSSHAIRTSPTN